MNGMKVALCVQRLSELIDTCAIIIIMGMSKSHSSLLRGEWLVRPARPRNRLLVHSQNIM